MFKKMGFLVVVLMVLFGSQSVYADTLIKSGEISSATTPGSSDMTVVIKDNATGDTHEIVITDNFTKNKFKDGALKIGDIVRLKFDDIGGRKVSKMFRKTDSVSANTNNKSIESKYNNKNNDTMNYVSISNSMCSINDIIKLIDISKDKIINDNNRNYNINLAELAFYLSYNFKNKDKKYDCREIYNLFNINIMHDKAYNFYKTKYPKALLYDNDRLYFVDFKQSSESAINKCIKSYQDPGVVSKDVTLKFCQCFTSRTEPFNTKRGNNSDYELLRNITVVCEDMAGWK